MTIVILTLKQRSRLNFQQPIDTTRSGCFPFSLLILVEGKCTYRDIYPVTVFSIGLAVRHTLLAPVTATHLEPSISQNSVPMRPQVPLPSSGNCTLLSPSVTSTALGTSCEGHRTCLFQSAKSLRVHPCCSASQNSLPLKAEGHSIVRMHQVLLSLLSINGHGWFTPLGYGEYRCEQEFASHSHDGKYEAASAFLHN